MSSAIAVQLGVIRASTGSSLASSRWVSSAGFTSSRPATSSGRTSASRVARVPPIDRPATKTRSQTAASSSKAVSTAVVHWSCALALQSCQRVPWPGSSGHRTAKPSAARCSPHGRMLIGVPVNPCTSRTPVRPSGPSPPGKANGSAPGITSRGTVGPDTGVLLGVRRRRRPVLRVHRYLTPATDCDSALRLLSLAAHEGGVLFYWFLKFVAIGPVVHAVFRPRAEGTQHVPATGRAILASNHLSAAHWIFIPLQLKLQRAFLGQAHAVQRRRG